MSGLLCRPFGTEVSVKQAASDYTVLQSDTALENRLQKHREKWETQIPNFIPSILAIIQTIDLRTRYKLAIDSHIINKTIELTAICCAISPYC